MSFDLFIGLKSLMFEEFDFFKQTIINILFYFLQKTFMNIIIGC